MGVWIETDLSAPVTICTVTSHPMWVCGLKLVHPRVKRLAYIVTPYVGVWIETFDNAQLKESVSVTPYVGVWIETICFAGFKQSEASHTLCGCVD